MIKAKFSDFYRRSLYFLFGLSWFSGSAFFILSRFCMIEGEFGPQRNPLQFPMLMVHGGSAFLVMFYFGFIMASHVPITWKLKKIRGIGIFLVSAICFQILSAYLLYYMANEHYREFVANIHAAVGFLLPLILFVHITHALKLRQAKLKN